MWGAGFDPRGKVGARTHAACRLSVATEVERDIQLTVPIYLLRSPVRRLGVARTGRARVMVVQISSQGMPKHIIAPSDFFEERLLDLAAGSPAKARRRRSPAQTSYPRS
jgi:hypothetical protein